MPRHSPLTDGRRKERRRKVIEKYRGLTREKTPEEIKEDTRKHIMEFAEKMIEVACNEKNIIKGDSWKTMDIDSLKHHLRSEFYEWRDSEDMDEEESDRRELVDMGIVEMMLWHRLKMV